LILHDFKGENGHAVNYFAVEEKHPAAEGLVAPGDWWCCCCWFTLDL